MISFARIVPAALSIVIFLAGCSLAEDVTPPPGYQEPTAAPQAVSAAVTLPQIAPDPANGASIFAEKCAPCHGSAGMGDGPQ
ncbi:MAG TPA: c-type cytochrome, partial [Anaerolineaceae bacterium]